MSCEGGLAASQDSRGARLESMPVGPRDLRGSAGVQRAYLRDQDAVGAKKRTRELRCCGVSTGVGPRRVLG